MEITDEILNEIYLKAQQYAITKWGSKPDTLKLDEDSIDAEWIDYCCGESNYTNERIYAENLKEDLLEVAAKRLIKEEQDRKEREIKRIEEDKKRLEREKIQRKIQFDKLAKEFAS